MEATRRSLLLNPDHKLTMGTYRRILETSPQAAQIIGALRCYLFNKIYVGISVINFNRSDRTRRCVANILSLAQIPYLIVVLDNGSKHYDNREIIPDFIDSTNTLYSGLLEFQHFSCQLDLYYVVSTKCYILFVSSNKNLGFCLGHNLIVEFMEAIGITYVVILNNDVVVTPGCFEILLSTARQSGAGAVSPLIYDETGELWYAGGRVSWYGYRYSTRVDSIETPYYTEVYSGCCVIFAVDVYFDLGGMNNKLFICLDEPDFSRRIKKSGYKIFVEPRAKVVHEVGSTLGRKGSRYHDYFWVRNRYLFSLLHNKPVIHLIFAVIYTGLRLFRWLIYFFMGSSYRIRAEVEAIRDFFVVLGDQDPYGRSLTAYLRIRTCGVRLLWLSS
jgi:GT2 family glycosyltransferase